jgi:hypothetical protein
LDSKSRSELSNGIDFGGTEAVSIDFEIELRMTT